MSSSSAATAGRRRLAELEAKIAAKTQLLESTQRELDALVKERDELITPPPPPRPSQPAPNKSAPLLTIQIAFNRPVLLPRAALKSAHTWEDAVSKVHALVNVLTKHKARFWVGMCSANTRLQRMRDPKYSHFGHLAFVFQTDEDEERRRMECALVSANPTRALNEINGGGGNTAGARPLFVYIVY